MAEDEQSKGENRMRETKIDLFPLGLLGDHHASTVSVGSMSECDRPPSQSSTIFGKSRHPRSDRFLILTMILRFECVRPVDNRPESAGQGEGVGSVGESP